MPNAKSKPKMARKVREGGFLFQIHSTETEVFKGSRSLGMIVGMKELSGRHCFRLAFDQRRQPRTYRGRLQAAEALQMIDKLRVQAQRERWSPEELIVRSWDVKPRASMGME